MKRLLLGYCLIAGCAAPALPIDSPQVDAADREKPDAGMIPDPQATPPDLRTGPDLRTPPDLRTGPDLFSCCNVPFSEWRKWGIDGCTCPVPDDMIIR